MTYNATTVPVFEGEGIDTPYQVIIGGYSDTDASNKHDFICNAVQDIEIVTIGHDPASKNSDAIAELVMNLIHPTVDSNLLSDVDFNVDVQGRPDMLPLREDSTSGQKVVRRILRYHLLMEGL